MYDSRLCLFFPFRFVVNGMDNLWFLIFLNRRLRNALLSKMYWICYFKAQLTDMRSLCLRLWVGNSVSVHCFLIYDIHLLVFVGDYSISRVCV